MPEAPNTSGNNPARAAGAVCTMRMKWVTEVSILLKNGLEILSISSYILCGMIQADLRSNESAMKYFLLGAFATVSMGMVGAFNIREFQQKSDVRIAPAVKTEGKYYQLGLE